MGQLATSAEALRGWMCVEVKDVGASSAGGRNYRAPPCSGFPMDGYAATAARKKGQKRPEQFALNIGS